MNEDNSLTTTDNYDPKVKAEAYDRYLTTDMSLSDIAIDLSLNSQVVASWARQGKWRDRKHEVEVELFNSAEDKYRGLLVKHRVPVMERHLRVSEKLESAIEKIIDDATKDDGVPSDMKIKRLAEALASVTGVSARAAGISEKPFSENVDTNVQGKKPLIVIGVQVQSDGAATIDIKDD